MKRNAAFRRASLQNRHMIKASVVKGAFLASLFAASAFAQQALSVGVLAGAPFTDVVSATNAGTLTSVPKSTNFTIGPMVQVDLPAGFRVEVDAMYRPYSFSETGPLGVVTNISAMDWTFPILGQYRLMAKSKVSPFVSAGLSFDHLSNISSAAKNITSGTGQLLRQSNAGVVLGGGVDFKIVPLFRISGELRYTHQGSADFAGLSNLNQAELLIGVHF